MLSELLAVNNTLIVEVRRADGSIVERYLGPSEEQLKYEHDEGRCDVFCGYCYHEAAKYLAANNIIRQSTLSVDFHPLPE